VSDRRVAALVFLVVLVAGQLSVGMRASATSDITGDEPFYLLTTQSLLSDGDLDVRDEYRNREYRRFWSSSVPLWSQMEPTEDGRLLVPHDPGLSLLVLPSYDAWGLRGAQRTLVVLWAVAFAMAAVVARRFGAPPGAAILGGIVAGAGCPGIVYASQLYPEAPAAVCVAGALLAVTARRATAPAVGIVVALSALAWLGVKYVPLGALLFAAWAWRHKAERRLVVLTAAVLAVSGAVYVWWHVAVFGGLTPYTTNVVYAGDGNATILAEHLEWTDRTYRLYGLFLDARFGLLRWLPAVAIAIWGVTRRTLLPGAVFAVGIVVGTFMSITMMGWWFPGRMLVAGLPALVVLLACGAARIPKTAAVLALWSFVIAGALVWSARTGGVRLAVDPFELGAPLAPAVLFPDFRQFGGREIALSAAWVTVLAAWRTLGIPKIMRTRR
jgi:hypothetical protein